MGIPLGVVLHTAVNIFIKLWILHDIMVMLIIVIVMLGQGEGVDNHQCHVPGWGVPSLPLVLRYWCC